MKSKRYTKRYYSKTKGEWVTYHYDKDKKRKSRVIYESGRINKSAVRRIAKEVGWSFEEVENRAKLWVKLGRVDTSELAITKSIKGEKIALMFANLGYSLDEAADEIGTTTEALSDDANWNFHGDERVYNDPVTGSAYEVIWTYDGGIFRMINE